MYRVLSINRGTTYNLTLSISGVINKNHRSNITLPCRSGLHTEKTFFWIKHRSDQGSATQPTTIKDGCYKNNNSWSSNIRRTTKLSCHLPPFTNSIHFTIANYSQLLQRPIWQITKHYNASSQVIVNTLPSRCHTTMSTNAETPQKRKKKKRKPRFSKYVELLEVTEQMANERKSRVLRLRAKELQKFIAKAQMDLMERKRRAETRSSPSADVEKQKIIVKSKKRKKQQPAEYQKNINLNAVDSTILETGEYDDKPLIYLGKAEHTKQVLKDPEKINRILKSFQNFRDVIESIDELERHESEAVIDAFVLNPNKSISEVDAIIETLDAGGGAYITPEIIAKQQTDSTMTMSARTTETKEKRRSRFKSKIHINEEQERLAKERALRINLDTYLNICVTAGMLNRAFSTIIMHRQRAKRSNIMESNLITIDLYNILLHGYAGQGSYERFKDVFAIISEDGLSFNEQTFAAIFECLGRLEGTKENKKLIMKYIEKAEAMGFTLDQIMDLSKFTADQRDITLDALQRVFPEYVPTYTPPPLGYVNPLLNDLNENLTPAGSEISKEKKTRKDVSAIMNSKRGFTKDQLEVMAREQLKIELDGYLTIKSIDKSKHFANANYCREKLKQHEDLWRSQINAAILRDLNTLKAQVRFKSHGYMSYYSYLLTLETAQFAEILLKEIYKLAEGSETFSPTVGQLYKELGQKVQQRYQIELKKRNGQLEKIGEIYSAYCDEWHAGNSDDNVRQMWQRLVHKERQSGPSMNVKEISWPTNVLTGVGRFLYNILMRDIKIDAHVMRQKSKTKQQNFLPAFYTLFRNQGRLVKEEIKPHPVLGRLYRASKQQTLTFDSNLVPMLCPPQPWSTPYNGGYLLNQSELIRLPNQAIQQWERINASNPQEIYPALDSLNQLSSIPWRVNTDILDVIIKVFQNGGDNKLDVSQPPSSLPPLPTPPQKDDSNVSNEERVRIFKERMAHRRKQAEMYSLWCDTLYRLSLAQHYRDKTFWLPHNMDFRGRVYPVPPHLNHLGSDLARSMLVFDQAQPLGVNGFNWLKLHCINLTGLKKRDSLHERLLYAEAIMDDILDSADNPLTGRMWWTESDEPWQTLACCMEIAKVKRSANPEAYLSNFPIHQDGSCNGLQHYAALGRDKAGAISVNLAPSDIPQDVYSAVATLVEKSRQADANNGIHVAQALEGFVRRKVIKQTVMTTVYGVTRYGARLQIARQLKDIDNFPKDWVWPASTYLTTKTFESLREMFTSTREIQDWFTECARLISGTCHQNVEWVTPLGLPVVQPYSRQEFKHITRKSTSRISETMAMDLYERPNVMKQKNAFPPNFIHSLDSSHMMLTSLNCEKQGLTFVSVHDCFWTHACTVPDLSRICRQQFVALHSQPILEDLSLFLRERFSFKESDFSNDGSMEEHTKRRLNRLLRQLPKKGDFELEKVMDSIYFFS